MNIYKVNDNWLINDIWKYSATCVELKLDYLWVVKHASKRHNYNGTSKQLDWVSLAVNSWNTWELLRA